MTNFSRCNHSLPSSAKVKNICSRASSPISVAWCLIKLREKFTCMLRLTIVVQSKGFYQLHLIKVPWMGITWLSIVLTWLLHSGTFFLYLSAWIWDWTVQWLLHTRSDNKVHELTTGWCHGSSVQKPQYGLITAYQCFTAVLLLIYDSLSEWRILSECVLMCHHENVRAWIRATNKN
jgi:hypothetical protein